MMCRSLSWLLWRSAGDPHELGAHGALEYQLRPHTVVEGVGYQAVERGRHELADERGGDERAGRRHRRRRRHLRA